MQREKDNTPHGQHEQTEAEQKRQDVPRHTPDTTEKKDGVTSAFSAGTDEERDALDRSEDTIGNP